jgi:hypothetical protein
VVEVKKWVGTVLGRQVKVYTPAGHTFEQRYILRGFQLDFFERVAPNTNTDVRFLEAYDGPTTS